MSSRLAVYAIAAAVLLAVGAAVGILGWQALTAGSGEPSEPISAPTIDINAEPTLSQTQAARFATENAQLRDEIAQMAEQATGTAIAAARTPTPTPTSDDPEEQEDSTTPSAAEGRALFRITQERSAVRFIIEEVLAGSPNTVTGETDQVAGDILVDFDNPPSSTVGTIRINMRTLATDNPFRNRSLRSSIFHSNEDQYEFAEFVPTQITGLPDEVALGDAIDFQITGDLTVTGTTHPVTFNATVNLASPEQLEGTASTTVRYQDFNLTIPEVPTVSDIQDDVILEIEFVALRVEDA